MGSAITMAKPVIQSVPKIKGKNPNSPLDGFHSVVESSVHKVFCSRMGCDFKYKPMPMPTTSRSDRVVSPSITPLASLSLNILFENFLFIKNSFAIFTS